MYMDLRVRKQWEAEEDYTWGTS